MIPNYPKFREWLTLKGYSSATVATIVKQIVDFLKWAGPENIPDPGEMSYNDMMGYVKSCQERGVSQKTIAHYLSDVRKFYDFLISEGIARENPAAFVKLRGIKRRVYYTILSPEQLQQLYRKYPVIIEYEPGKIIPPQEQSDRELTGQPGAPGGGDQSAEGAGSSVAGRADNHTSPAENSPKGVGTGSGPGI
jgi:hypothetical protein